MRSRGNERGVRVHGLGDGERIIPVSETLGANQQSAAIDQDGTYPLPEKWDRIRFIKMCEGEGSPTQVDLLVE